MARKPTYEELEKRVRELEAERAVITTNTSRAVGVKRDLDEEQHYFRSLLHSIHEDIFVIDRNYEITDVNNTSLVTSGFSRQDVIGRKCFEVLHGFDAPCDAYGEECPLMDVFETGSFANCTHQHRHSKGSGTMVDIRFSALKDPNGTVTHVVEAMKDVTELFDTKTALQEKGHQQKALADISRMALEGRGIQAVFDEATRILAKFLSAEFCAFLEFVPEQGPLLLRSGVGWREGLLGDTTIDRGADSLLESVLSADGPVVFENVSSENQAKIPQIFRDHHIDNGISIGVRQEGKLFGVLGAYNSAKRLFSEEEIDFLKAMADLLGLAIGRERAERAMREEKQRLTRIIENMPVMMVASDRDGKIIYWNKECERVTGFSKEEIIGNPKAAELLYPDKAYRERMMEELKVRGDDYYHWEWEMASKDGDTKIVAWSNLSKLFPVPQWARWSVGVDVTEKRKTQALLREHSEKLEEAVRRRTQELRNAQEELLRREKLTLLGQVAAGLGHELRNPLGAIKNAAYFLKLDAQGADSGMKEALEILDKEVANCERIICGLLSFVHPTPPLRNRLDVNEQIREALSQVWIPENVRLETALEDSLPPIMGDPTQLGQVFQNLALNAIQAMPEGGRLLVTSEAEAEGKVKISFSDTGVGISKSDMEKLFEPLFSTKPMGIGLGLSLIKTFLDAHGGKIQVKSEPAKGTTVTVYLPG